MEVVVILSMIFGGVSALVGVGGLFARLVRLDNFAALVRATGRIKARPEGENLPPDEKLLVEWLGYGSLLLPALKAKFTYRLVISLALILAACLFARVDLPGQVLPATTSAEQFQQFKTNNFEVVDIALFAAVIIVGLINRTSLLLDPVEKEFLESVKALEMLLYRTHVYTAMNEFNIQVRRTPLFRKTVARDRSDREKRGGANDRNAFEGAFGHRRPGSQPEKHPPAPCRTRGRTQ